MRACAATRDTIILQAYKKDWSEIQASQSVSIAALMKKNEKNCSVREHPKYTLGSCHPLDIIPTGCLCLSLKEKNRKAKLLSSGIFYFIYFCSWQNKSQSVNKITTRTTTIGTTPSVQIKRPWDSCIFWNFFEKTNKQNN